MNHRVVNSLVATAVALALLSGFGADTQARPVTRALPQDGLIQALPEGAVDLMVPEPVEAAFERLTDLLSKKGGPIDLRALEAAAQRILRGHGADPVATHQLYQVASVLATSGDLEPARVVLQAFAGAHPSRADVQSLLGHVRMILGDYRGAAVAMSSAETHGADHLNTIRLALVHELSGHVPQTIEAIDRALKRAPELHDLHLRRAMLWLYSDVDRAISELNRFIREHRGFYDQLHSVEWEEGEAARLLAESLGGERRVDVLVSVAMRFVTAGASPFVLSLAHLMDQQWPGHPAAGLLRGSFYAQMHMLEPARETYEQAAGAVTAETDDILAYAIIIGAVEMNLNLGDAARAERAARLAAKAGAWSSLIQARLLRHQGKRGDAEALLRDFSEDPGIGAHWRNLCDKSLGAKRPLRPNETSI